ncbi:sortase [Lacrimispora sp. NSJ-141]|uniref:Sortase n=1 Tax=Lientehia hominis TaxID=2897778 RepID=A0AAP2RI95_9FIRM|nr:sortase [Lientehia hominis]
MVGHNYKNDSHFGWLDELETGAVVRLTDKYGEAYEYVVYGIQIIAPDEINVLEDYEGEHALALITCTASGKNRLVVKCRLTSALG